MGDREPDRSGRADPGQRLRGRTSGGTGTASFPRRSGGAAQRLGGGTRAFRRHVRRPLCRDARMGGAGGPQGHYGLAARPLFRDHLTSAAPVHFLETSKPMADTDIVCTSPVDGREFVRRPIMSDAAVDAAVAAARAAQRAWRSVPLQERSAAVLRFLDALLAMNQEVVPELAQQMGRPVRYGGEFRGVEERTRSMVRIAEVSLKPMVPEDERPGLRRTIKRE